MNNMLSFEEQAMHDLAAAVPAQRRRERVQRVGTVLAALLFVAGIAGFGAFSSDDATQSLIATLVEDDSSDTDTTGERDEIIQTDDAQQIAIDGSIDDAADPDGDERDENANVDTDQAVGAFAGRGARSETDGTRVTWLDVTGRGLDQRNETQLDQPERDQADDPREEEDEAERPEPQPLSGTRADDERSSVAKVLSVRVEVRGEAPAFVDAHVTIEVDDPCSSADARQIGTSGNGLGYELVVGNQGNCEDTERYVFIPLGQLPAGDWTFTIDGVQETFVVPLASPGTAGPTGGGAFRLELIPDEPAETGTVRLGFTPTEDVCLTGSAGSGFGYAASSNCAASQRAGDEQWYGAEFGFGTVDFGSTLRIDVGGDVLSFDIPTINTRSMGLIEVGEGIYDPESDTVGGPMLLHVGVESQPDCSTMDERLVALDVAQRIVVSRFLIVPGVACGADVRFEARSGPLVSYTAELTPVTVNGATHQLVGGGYNVRRGRFIMDEIDFEVAADGNGYVISFEVPRKRREPCSRVDVQDLPFVSRFNTRVAVEGTWHVFETWRGMSNAEFCPVSNELAPVPIEYAVAGPGDWNITINDEVRTVTIPAEDTGPCVVNGVTFADSLMSAKECQIAEQLLSSDPGWQDKWSRVADEDPCNWWGLNCGPTGLESIVFHHEGSVAGPFIDEMGGLDNLQTLLSRQPIVGEFPSFVRDLAKIDTIQLTNQPAPLVVPAWLGEVTTLESLTLEPGSTNAVAIPSLKRLGLWGPGPIDQQWVDLNPNLAHLTVRDEVFASLDLPGWVCGTGFTGCVKPTNLDTCMDGNGNQNLFGLSANECQIMDALRDSGWVLGNSWIFANPCVWDGIACNENGLSGFEIENETLAFTDSMGGLVNLETVSLVEGQRQQLPPWIRKLVNLRELTFTEQSVRAILPTWLGELPNLDTLTIDAAANAVSIPSLRTLNVVPRTSGAGFDQAWIELHPDLEILNIPTELQSDLDLSGFSCNLNLCIPIENPYECAIDGVAVISVLPASECQILDIMLDNDWRRQNWGRGDPSDPCDWLGLECGESGLRVINLNDWSGDFIDEMGGFSGLQVLKINERDLGAVPDFVRELQNLREFGLTEESQVIVLPEWLAELPLLETLRVEHPVQAIPIPSLRTLHMRSSPSPYQTAPVDQAWIDLNPDLERLEGLPIAKFQQDLDLSGWSCSDSFCIRIQDPAQCAIQGVLIDSVMSADECQILDEQRANGVSFAGWSQAVDPCTSSSLGCGPNGLRSIYLNDVTAPLSDAMGRLVNLEVLQLIETNRNAPPEWVRQLVNLKELEMTDEGPDLALPTWLDELTKLETLTIEAQVRAVAIPSLRTLNLNGGRNGMFTDPAWTEMNPNLQRITYQAESQLQGMDLVGWTCADGVCDRDS